MNKAEQPFIRVIVLGLFCFLSLFTSGQIQIKEPSYPSISTYRQMVERTLIGSGVLIGHFYVKAPIGAIGLFSLDTEQNLVKKGLVLSTGKVVDIQGPNDTTNMTTEFQEPGDDDLNNSIGFITSDAVAIEFDFIPFTDSIGFYYFFGSEEYPEYVGKGFNDAFAFLIRGPGYPYYTNIARLIRDGKTTPITIDNLNFLVNRQFYIPNQLKEDRKLVKKKQWGKELKEPEMLNEIEFDGMTKKLRAVAHVEPGSIYRIKIVIADVGDQKYDSGVFLEKESFGVIVPTSASVDTNLLLTKFKQYYKKKPAQWQQVKDRYNYVAAPKPVQKEVSNLQEKFYIHYKSDSFQLSTEGKKIIDQKLKNFADKTKIEVKITGHTDATGATLYNSDLSQKRAQGVLSYMKELGISIKSTSSQGESAPIASNKTTQGKQKNRRVEIIISKKK